MTPEQMLLVQATWRQVVPISDLAAQLFYDRLFELAPDTRALFHGTDPKEQRRKLMATLAFAVEGLGDLDTLVPTVEALGRRHRDYGATAAHYETVGAALLWTLKEGLGVSWTPAAEAAWSEAYGLLSGVMQGAAGAAPPATAPSPSLAQAV